MGDRILQNDIEFLRLVTPLTDEEYRNLECKLITDGYHTPISVWDNIIVDGFHEYEICVNNHIPFSIRRIDFKNREEAICWIAKRQIAKSNPKGDLHRYQIGKRYNAERALNAATPRKRHTGSGSLRNEKAGFAGHIAREYGLSHFAVHSYKDIANAVDTIASKDPRLSDRYLAGSLRISQTDLITISELPQQFVRSLMNALIRQGKKNCKSEDILEALSAKDRNRENQSAKERRRATSMVGQPSVKDMPSFDPDSEVVGLSLTMPSWASSIDRVFRNTDVESISETAKKKLNHELIALRDSVEIFLLAIEEASNDGK